MSNNLENWGLKIPSKSQVRKSLDEFVKVVNRGGVQTPIPNNQDDELKVIHSLIHQPSYALVYPETETELGYPIAQRILNWHNQQLEQVVIEARIDELRRLVPDPVAETASIDHSDELIRLYEDINNRFAQLSKSKEKKA